MLVLAYLGILSLVPLLVEKHDREIQWHAKNGVVLFAAWVVLIVADTMLTLVLHPLACVLTLLWPLLSVLYIGLIVVAIMKALKGERLVIPYLTPLSERF
jgi:uncharacterized membrane protein